MELTNKSDTARAAKLMLRIRGLTALFIFGLVVSGVTAIPLKWELDLLLKHCGEWLAIYFPQISEKLIGVHGALTAVDETMPFLFYGTDWLAFGHFIIALAFVWAWREPIHNRWMFDFGLIACALVLPYAFIFGGLRGIPIWWRLVDCSFGMFGAIPLWLCRRYAMELDQGRPAKLS